MPEQVTSKPELPPLGADDMTRRLAARAGNDLEPDKLPTRYGACAATGADVNQLARSDEKCRDFWTITVVLCFWAMLSYMYTPPHPAFRRLTCNQATFLSPSVRTIATSEGSRRPLKPPWNRLPRRRDLYIPCHL